MDKELPIYKCNIDDSLNSGLQINYIALVDEPAIQKNFLAFNKAKLNFSIDQEKRIISGPAMIADMLIYRNQEPLGEFYTVFDKEAISQIVQKFFKQGFVHNFNLMHDDNKLLPQLTIYESFLTNKERGIMPMKGFDDVADGSWFITAKVEDDSVWEKIKSGEVKGFSVEGLFEQIPVKMKLTPEQIYDRIKELLEMID